MNLKAYAKINWTLNITGRRADGYHLMDMLMQSIQLHDDIQLSPRTDKNITLTVDGAALQADESNLAYRAAALLSAHCDVQTGVDIRLTKRIPMGAGLGGGSADAAAILDGLCELWNLPLSLEEKCALGLKLGADVPYCLYRRPARVQGIGEQLMPIAMARPYPLVLLQPCEALSTKEAFHYFDTQPTSRSADNDAAIQAFAANDIHAIANSCFNVMQPASELLRPAMKDAILDLSTHGAFLSQMTGSGSVVFGAFETDAAADRAYEHLRTQYSCCIRTQTL